MPARIEEWRQIEKGLPWVTLATIALIALVLGIHFRSPVAPLVTLLSAGVAYLVAMRTVAFIGEWLDVSIPREAEPILIVLLLGVVTDYAVFFLHGLRERLDAGEERLEAAEAATAEYLPIVVTAGLIVAGGHGLADGRRARVLPRVRPRDGVDRADLARGRDHARPGADGDPRPAPLLAVAPRPRERRRKARAASRTSRPRGPWRS